jgi:hypothetical protein
MLADGEIWRSVGAKAGCGDNVGGAAG